MTEQEIVDYLKENKTRGTTFAFMPEEVRKWCIKHRDERIFCIVDEGEWIVDAPPVMCHPDSTYCLDADYEPKQEFKPHYEEFDVNKNGFFHIKDGSDWVYYHWFNWQKFIEENFDKYNKFGGWLFNNKIWCTNPQLTTQSGVITDYTSNNDNVCEPVMPTKIRFWRYRE